MLSCLMVVFSVPTVTFAVGGTEYTTTDQAIEYQYYDSGSESWNTGSLAANTYNLVDTGTAWEDSVNGGWYVVGGDVTISERVTVTGDVKLVLTDGNTLQCAAGIEVPEGSSLTIYGQKSGTGTLNSTGADNADAGIGVKNSTVTIHGGIINAVGDSYRVVGYFYDRSFCGAGIGGTFVDNQAPSTGGSLVVYGGKVNAQGMDDGGYGRSAPGISVTLTTGAKGNAMIKANGIYDTSNSGSWSAIICNNSSIEIYGNQTLSEDLVIHEQETLSISSGMSLTVPQGVTLTNQGTLNVAAGGTLTFQGDFSNDGSFLLENGGTVEIAGVFENQNSTIVNGSLSCGEINNSDVIKINSTGSLSCGGGTNTGFINNEGSLTNTGTISGQGGLIYSTTEVAGADGQLLTEFRYLDENGEPALIDSDCGIHLVAASDNTWQKEDGKETWYVVAGNVTISNGVVLSDDINLLLLDNASLTVEGRNDNGGINAANHTISIYAQSNGSQMGKLTATPGHYNWMSLGGENSTVNIYGGYIDASNTSGHSGIGCGVYRTWNRITITGGVVKAASIGTMGGPIGKDGFGLSAPEGSNGIVYVTNNSQEGNVANTFHGILFFKGNGKVYGNQDLAMDLTIEEDETLTVPAGTTLTIPKGVTLTVKGTLVVEGTVENNGSILNQGTITNQGKVLINLGSSFTGTAPSTGLLSYQMCWDVNGDGSVDDFTYAQSGEMPSHTDGSKDPTVDTVYTFTDWSPAVTAATQPAVYTAQFTSGVRSYFVTLPQNPVGYAILTEDGTQVNYGDDFTFQVSTKEGYTATDRFAVKANGESLTPAQDGSYRVTVLQDVEITVEGVEDITPPANLQVSYETDYFREFLHTITFGLFFKDTVEVTISAQDAGSGVKEISYQLGDGQRQTVAAENGSIRFYVEPQFAGNISRVSATDYAGNSSEEKSYEYFAVDGKAPTAPTVDMGSYTSGEWTDGPVSITLSGSYALSGIEKYQYSTDGGQSWMDLQATQATEATAVQPANVTQAKLTVSAPSATADGTTYLFRGVSNSGITGTASSGVVVKIDSTAPAIRVSGNTGDYLQKDTVTVTPSAGVSGIAKVEVVKDNGKAQDITASWANGYEVTENGTYTFTVTNGVGTAASASITYDKLDNTTPVVSLDTHGYTSGQWAKEDVVLSASNTALNLGPTVLEYKVDNGQWQTYQGAITVSAETEGTSYTFRAISASGLVSQEVSVAVKLDKTAPEGDIAIQENSVKTLLNQITFGLFFRENVDVLITAEDGLSGVGSVEYYRSQDILTQEQVAAITDWTAYRAPVSETAQDAQRFVYYVKLTDNAGNVTCFASNGVTFDLTAPVISGVVDGETYYTTQKVTVQDANLDSVTLNGTSVTGDILLAGNTDTTYRLIARDKAGNETTVTVTMKPIESLSQEIDGLTPENVTSLDQQKVEEYLEDLNTRLEDENLTQQEKEILQNLVEEGQALLDQIQQAAQAAQDEAIQKVDGITPDTVVPEDQQALEQAKDKIQQALTDYAGNYTQQETQTLEEAKDRVEAALEVLQKVEDVQTAIEALPDSVLPSDTQAEEQIQAVKDLYDQLSDYEKSLVSGQGKDKLETLLAQLGDYRITQGDGSTWTKGSGVDLTILANGANSKFTGLMMDGSTVDPDSYQLDSGMVVTLKAEYLEGLAVGEHTFTVLYTDGEAQGVLTIVEKPVEVQEDNTPQTGENSDLLLWTAVMLAAGAGLTGTLLYRRKGKIRK